MAQLTLMLRRAKRNNETKLDLSAKQQSFIPKDIYQLQKLEIVNLSHNQIETIEISILQLKNLKVLDLSYNNISQVPECLLQLPKLEVLMLEGNPLKNQFKPLLDSNANSNIKQSLRRCLGKSGSLQQQSYNNEGQTDPLSNSKTFGKMVEMKTQYEKQQKKVIQLQQQLNRMYLKEKRSSKESFNIDPEPILQITPEQIVIKEQISMGGFSTIHHAIYMGLPVAVKKVFNPKLTPELLHQFSNEINILAKYRHPNIVLLIGICSIPSNLSIITEYIPLGSLYVQLHKKKQNFSQENNRSIVKQCLNSIHYLHSHGIVHRDIKSHNFLIDDNLVVKLCDFGLARSKANLGQGPMQYSGTPVYMAQELFNKTNYDQTVDIFALGTLIYEIYTKNIPYDGLDPLDIKDKIMSNHQLPPHSQLNSNILQLSTHDINSIVNGCRVRNPKQRPSVLQLIQANCW